MDDVLGVLVIAALLFLAGGGWLIWQRRDLELGDWGMAALLWFFGAVAGGYALVLGK